MHRVEVPGEVEIHRVAEGEASPIARVTGVGIPPNSSVVILANFEH